MYVPLYVQVYIPLQGSIYGENKHYHFAFWEYCIHSIPPQKEYVGQT